MIDVQSAFKLKAIKSHKKERRAKAALDAADGQKVYFISDAQTGLTKIGFTVHLGKRLAEIAWALERPQDDFKLEGYIITPHGMGRALEKALHTRFAKDRDNGEWFNLKGHNCLHEALEAIRGLGGADWPIKGLASDYSGLSEPRWAMSKTEQIRLAKGGA